MNALTHQGIRLGHAYRPGRTTAGLVFRVGHADETLPSSGLTALVVALALRAVERPGLEISGSVGPATTMVRVGGSDERVAMTLRELSRALADPPLRYRAAETRGLLDDGGGNPVASWRFGMRGYGLGGHRFGLHTVPDEGVRAWARERFAASNAVAWTVGEAPVGLDLPLAPGVSGAPFPPPPVTAPVIPLPADVPAGGTEVRFDAVVADRPAAELFAEVARRALFRDVRQAEGWAYDVSAGLAPLDGQWGTLQVSANLSRDTAAAATGEFLDGLGRLRYAVSDAEVAAARTHLLAPFAEPHQEAMWIVDDARLAVLGRPVPTPAQRRAALESVTSADVVAVARQAWESAVVVAPVGEGWAGTSVARRGTGSPISGTVYERIDATADLVIAAEGATLRHGPDPVTVRFAEAAALLAFPDGGRVLIGPDGANVPFEPTLHDDLGPGEPAALLDGRVPPHLVVPMPAREVPERPDPDRLAEVRQARQERAGAEPSPARTAGRATWTTVRLILAVIGVAVGIVLLRAGVVGLVEGVIALERGDATTTDLVRDGVSTLLGAWLTWRMVVRVRWYVRLLRGGDQGEPGVQGRVGAPGS